MAASLGKRDTFWLYCEKGLIPGIPYGSVGNAVCCENWSCYFDELAPISFSVQPNNVF